MDGVSKEPIIGMVNPEILEYVQHVVRCGASARISPTGERLKPYSSYLEYEQEGKEKSWTELTLGRTMMCTTAVEEFLLGTAKYAFSVVGF